MRHEQHTKVILLFILILHIQSLPSSQALGTQLVLSPTIYKSTQIGQRVLYEVQVQNISNLWAYTTSIHWNPEILEYVESIEGPFLKQNGRTIFVTRYAWPGYINEIACARFEKTGIDGNGTLFYLVFKTLKETNNTQIGLTNSVMLEPSSYTEFNFINHSIVNATINISQGNLVAKAGNDIVVEEDTSVVFDASNSIGNITGYQWDFNYIKHVILTGITPEFYFERPGTYIVHLTVEDGTGESKDLVSVTVKDVTPPLLKYRVTNLVDGKIAKDPQIIVDLIGEPVTLEFDASESIDPKNGTIASYYWEFQYTLPEEGSKISNKYDAVGDYWAKITIADEAGNTSSETIYIKVEYPKWPMYAVTMFLLTILFGPLILKSIRGKT